MNEVFYLRQNHYKLRNFNVLATNNPRNKYLQILIFTERTNSGKHYPLKLTTVHQCSSLKIKKKLGPVIDVNARFAQHALLIFVTFSLYTCDPKSTQNKTASL